MTKLIQPPKLLRLQTKGSRRNQITRLFVKLHNIVTDYFTTHYVHENTQDVGTRPLFYVHYDYNISMLFLGHFSLCVTRPWSYSIGHHHIIISKWSSKNHIHLNVKRCNWLNATTLSRKSMLIYVPSTYYLNIKLVCAYLKWKCISYFPFGTHSKTPTCRAPK